jgi:hypothetical protein
MDSEHKAPAVLESDEQYTAFLRVRRSPPPRTCPYCQTDTIRLLWLGDPDFVIDGEIWGKWYLWCERCLKGIRCPLGSYTVPPGEPYVRWGDDEALKRALPSELQLIVPEFKENPKQKELQRGFDAAGGTKPSEPDSTENR